MVERSGESFLESVFGLVKKALFFSVNHSVPVVEFEHPDVLKEQLKPALEDNSNGCCDEELQEICSLVLRYSVKTNHMHFHNQLYGGVDPYALAGTFLSEALNTSQYTYEVAPAFTLIEQAIIERTITLFGLGLGGDGLFCPGGSASNMAAMATARYKYFPKVKEEGLSRVPRLAIFTSQDAHYSIKKGANWLGLGTKNVISVKTNNNGQMLISELEEEVLQARKRGLHPFFVNATAGTTVLGAIDPLEEVYRVCKKYNLWFHIDACWGGSLLLSKKYKMLLNGIQRADSISWNAHKMLGAPLQCSLLLVREGDLMHTANSASAAYLFQQDKFYNVLYDTGNKSVQCGRKVDAFKLWLMWKARGEIGLGELVDNAVEMASYFQSVIAKRPGFRLVGPCLQCTNVCFWFVPEEMRGQIEDEIWWQKIHKVTTQIKQAIILSGQLMIGYMPLKHHANFFRLVVTCHPRATTTSMEHVADCIEKCGRDIQCE